MSRAPLWRALLALAVIAASSFAAITLPAQLGLDLRGGTQIVLQTRDSPTVEADSEATDRALEVLRRRVDALGVAEPTLARAGENRIIIELPGLQDPTEAAELVGRTAQLLFHPVLGLGDPSELPTEGATTEAPTEGATTEAPTEGATTEESSDGATEAPTDEATTEAPTDEATTDVPTDDGTTTDVPTEGATDVPTDGAATEGGRTIPDEDGVPVQIGPAALTGDGVESAAGVIDPQSGLGWLVTIDFTGPGGQAWADLTAEAACAPPGAPQRRVAIALDDEIISSPQVQETVPCGVGIPGGSTQITGNFTQEEAQGLAVLIEGGALPVPVEIIEQRSVGPTLGAAAIDASAKAAVIGIALTGLFIVLVYRLVGLLATIALASYTLISYAALVALGATLTLPGLAGFVLAIGIAVDANVLVFERAREEFNAGRRKGLRSALVIGFNKAWSAIIDSNVTTLLASGLLFFLASGPVRGFGVTLSIGVLASMVSALVISRVLTEFAVSRGVLGKHPALSGIASTGRIRKLVERSRVNLMARRRLWLSLAAVLAFASIVGVGVRGLDLGVEFTGGRVVDYTTTQQIGADVAREVVSDAGFPRAVVQSSDEDNISVRTGQLENEDVFVIQDALAEAGAGDVSVLRDELIGPSLGSELRNRALIALGVALAAQLLYLAIRFRWTFGAAAVTAMLHDVIVVIGFFAWTGKPVDGVFLAALLTVIGYSVNDKVVVFDRVREMVRENPGGSFADIAGRAVLNTIPRTVNTGIGALFILTTLAVLGGDSLTDFALALIVGIVIGLLSSMFVATPLAVVLEQRVPRPPEADADELNPHVRSETAGAGKGRGARAGAGRGPGGRRDDGWDGAVV